VGAFTTVPTTTIESNLAQYTGGYDTVVADVQWTADGSLTSSLLTMQRLTAQKLTCLSLSSSVKMSTAYSTAQLRLHWQIPDEN